MLVNLRSLWDFDHPDVSEKRFRDLVLESDGKVSCDFHCEILTQVARAQGLQRNFDGSRVTLHQVRDLLDESTPKARIRYFLELGRLENSSGDPECAKPHFTMALKLAQEAGEDFLAVDAAHMMGIVEKGEKSLEWNEKAIAMAEASSEPDARNWLASLYNNTAWTYHDMGQYDRALALFEKALAFREMQGGQGPILIARWCIARCLRSMGQVERALVLQRELEAIHTNLGNHPGFVFEEIAECLLLLGKKEESKPYFAKAYEALSKDPWIDKSRVERLREMSATM